MLGAGVSLLSSSLLMPWSWAGVKQPGLHGLTSGQRLLPTRWPLFQRAMCPAEWVPVVEGKSERLCHRAACSRRNTHPREITCNPPRRGSTRSRLWSCELASGEGREKQPEGGFQAFQPFQTDSRCHSLAP